MNEYAEIDLVDLLFYYLKKWRWIVTIMLVVAVAMGISQYQGTITENASKQKLILEEKMKEKEEADTDEAQEEAEVLVLEDPKISAMKASIIGMAIGLFITMLLIMPGYILCGKLQNIERFNENFGIQLLGLIFVPENPLKGFHFIDRWILQLEKGPCVKIPYEEQVRISVLNIQNAIRKEEKLKKIMLAGTLSEKEAEEMRFALVSESEIEGVYFSNYKQMIFQASAMKEMENYDGILFIEKRGKSYSKYIKWEKDLAASRGVNILGAVIF